ncbi:MAG: DUF962 domain-containing protein [Acidobacteria bacterium]|nr:DUF962 domain-containing protein [Acidobacteriota bacterium]
MNPSERIKSFQEFWPYYVREHSRPGCRLLHFIGSSAGLICLIVSLFTGKLWLILLGLLIGYGFAWTGHFFIEHNKPATFKYPLWSFISDWKMWSLMLTGQMNAEVERALHSA